MRLADEYDAAQARGEAARHSSGNPQIVPNKNDLPKTAADLGLDRKIILEARRVRDAEKAKPGIVEKALAAAGEPTRARLKRAVDQVLEPPQRPTAQGEVAAKAVAQEEGRQQEIAEPTEREIRAYVIGYRKAAEILADIFEVIAECEKEKNTPESKIRAEIMAAAAAAARALEKDKIYDDEEEEEDEEGARDETEANEQERG
jgi:hypothetical protein